MELKGRKLTRKKASGRLKKVGGKRRINLFCDSWAIKLRHSKKIQTCQVSHNLIYEIILNNLPKIWSFHKYIQTYSLPTAMWFCGSSWPLLAPAASAGSHLFSSICVYKSSSRFVLEHSLLQANQTEASKDPRLKPLRVTANQSRAPGSCHLCSELQAFPLPPKATGK